MISIIDYGMGNSASVKKAFDFLGITSQITNDPAHIRECKKILIPGVGAFGDAVDSLHRLSLFDAIQKAVIEDKKPILGICLGMQLLATASEESLGKQGFGFIDTTCRKFVIDQKIPHVGWNNVTITSKDSPLFHNIPDNSDFYFVHSFHFDNTLKNRSASTHYGYDFTCAIERDNIYGVQFHPEKSQKFGLEILKNFGELPC